MAEFGFYVFIRQLVNTKEWFTACSSIHCCFMSVFVNFCFKGRGEKGRLRKRLRGARTYEVGFFWVPHMCPTNSPWRNGNERPPSLIDFSNSMIGKKSTKTHFMIGCLSEKYATNSAKTWLSHIRWPGQAVLEESPREKRRPRLLRRLGDLHPCQLCRCGILPVCMFKNVG